MNGGDWQEEMDSSSISNQELVERVLPIFESQGIMRTLGAQIIRIEPGRAEIEIPFDARFTQQDGFLHAGIAATLMDSACGGAAYSLMPTGSGVLAVEFKVNFLAPAAGDRFRAVGEVLKSGRTLTVCRGELYAYIGETEKHVAAMQATMIRVGSD